MGKVAVEIGEEAYQDLRSMADESGESVGGLLEKAIEAYRRGRFLNDLNEHYAALRADAEAWPGPRNWRNTPSGNGPSWTASKTIERSPGRFSP